MALIWLKLVANMRDKTYVTKIADLDELELPEEEIPCLIILKGPSIGKTFVLEEKETLIGREDTCTVVLEDETLSRVHAKILKREKLFILEDMGSTNGSFLNGKKTRRAQLVDGDKIRLGDLIFRFAYHDAMDVGFQEDMRKMAMQDALTNLYNRRYFVHTLEREFKYAVRKETALSLLLFDIDGFKQVNDKYGHDAGDHVLWSIGSETSLEVRSYDTFARYGGEEFVILLRGSPLNESVIIATRILERIRNLTFDFDGQKAQVTVSMGVTSLRHEKDDDPQVLLQRADQLLYRAKDEGRDRISVG